VGVECDVVVYLDMLGGHSLLPDLNIYDMFYPSLLRWDMITGLLLRVILVYLENSLALTQF
jgi:hypothetical protein